MRIFRALGLGLALIILQNLLGEVFTAFEDTLLTFFRVLQLVLGTAESQVAALGDL